MDISQQAVESALGAYQREAGELWVNSITGRCVCGRQHHSNVLKNRRQLIAAATALLSTPINEVEAISA